MHTSIWTCMSHYPRHVSGLDMPIFRRNNCTNTASGIIALLGGCTLHRLRADWFNFLTVNKVPAWSSTLTLVTLVLSSRRYACVRRKRNVHATANNSRKGRRSEKVRFPSTSRRSTTRFSRLRVYCEGWDRWIFVELHSLSAVFEWGPHFSARRLLNCSKLWSVSWNPECSSSHRRLSQSS